MRRSWLARRSRLVVLGSCASLAALALPALLAACSGPPAPPPVAPPPPTVSVSAAPAPPPPPETPDDEFRKQPPALGERAPITPPAVAEGRLSNGVRALVIERHDLPFVALDLVVSWGAQVLPPGYARAWAFSLPTAAPAAGGPQLRDALEALAVEHSIDASPDAARMALHCLSPQLDDVLKILAERLAAPSYPGAEVKHLQEVTLQALGLGSPEDLLAAQADELLFAPGHPYRAPELGTAKSLAGLTDKELARFHAQHVRPELVTVVAVGDTSRAQLIERLERSFGAWKPTGAPPAQKAPPDKLAEGVFVLDGKRSDTRLLMALPAPARSSPDRAALMALRALLGARFSQSAREQSLGGFARLSRWDLTRYPGLFTISVSPAPAAVPAAVEALLDEAKKIEQGAFSDADLAAIKRALSRDLEAQLDRTIDTVWAASELPAYDLPATGIASYADAVHRLGRADVMAASKAYIRKDALRIVALGDAKALREPLAKLGLGKVTVKKAPEPPPSPDAAPAHGKGPGKGSGKGSGTGGAPRKKR